ncbi:AMP-binding protein [Streptomyces sp. NPDC052301]|uniref:AMP-binding protein n=1 Tax=Streptomyces sp. NPDC052301 TaxID=3365687 RepID=UPI0037D4E838
MPLIDALVAACEKYGSRTAVTHDGTDHSYAELAQASARIANGLVERGVAAGDSIGLLAPRGWWRCAAVLGIWRAGAAVVALDPALPAQRLARITGAAGTALVLRDAAVTPADRPDEPDGAGITVQDLHGAAADGPGPSLTGPVAYVVATSGSTGTPKCVAVPPVVLEDLAAWHRDTWRWTEAPRTAHAASVGFDVGFQELVTTWTAGAPLVVVDDRTRRDPFLLAALLTEQTVVRAFLPVASLHALAVAVPVTGQRPTALREVVVAGERLVVNEEVRALFAGLDATLVNQYGPSETHVVTEHRLAPGPQTWPVHPPLGAPVAGAELLHLADGVLRPFAEGDEAELVVAGPCLALGYLGDEELTGERFRTFPHVFGGSRRGYLTGDLVRLQDGVLHFVGRIDDQLKVRGYRVEPGEIEAVLGRVPGVRRAAVIGHGKDRTLALHAYVVTDTDAAGPVDASALRAACAAALPDYMVPARFIDVPELPLTANGKVARRELKELGAARG